MTRRHEALPVFLTAVSLAGAGAFGLHLLTALRSPTLPRPAEFALLAILLVACEQWPVSVQRRGGVDTVNLSGVFACALLLQWPVGWAIAVQLLASLIDDLRSRRSWWKAAFNAGQYSVSLSAAAAVTQALHLRVDGAGGARQVFVALVACLTFFVVNNVLTGVAMALACGERLLPFLLADLAFQASVNGAMTTMAPVVLAAGDRSPWLVPLLLVPAGAVYRGARISLEKEHRARHDDLTDLPNRLYFAEHVTEALPVAGPVAPAAGGLTAVMVMDLDSFKDLNDTLGHLAGDALLRQIWPRLLPALPEGAILARLGGDEFGVLLPELPDVDAVRACADGLLEALARPFDVEGTQLDVRASIGIALSPEHGYAPEQLIQCADIAMYVAKRNRSGQAVYSDEGNHHSRRRLTLLNELGPAMGRGQLRLHYQPKVHMHDGTLAGAEALLRWHHPELGDVSPAEFIPLAESTGLIRALTEFIVDDAVAQLQAWHTQGIRAKVSVNLSAQVLHDGAMVARILGALERAGVPASSLMVELTETALMADPQGTARALEELAAAGVLLSIDDFGTGHSALAYLARLPVAELKIDRSFVSHIDSNDANRYIVGSVVELARNLGITVVAEGIERVAEWQTLAALGCHVAQGFLVSRAVPAEEIRTAFASNRPLIETFAATFGVDQGTAQVA